MSTAGATQERPKGSAAEVFAAFAKLGLTSFGGPIAHLGYFRDEFVTRRKWLDEAAYADLVALCQFLPGPASSQVGFALGLFRAGPLGAAAAWTAFTLPSAALLVAFAYGASAFAGPSGSAALHGLKLVAVAVVAQAVIGMARTLCPDRARAGIALLAAILVSLAASALGQIAAILAGGIAGLALCRDGSTAPATALRFPVSRGAGAALLALALLLLAGLPLAASALALPGLAHFDAFYRAGALVFGGGHVVLPLLQAEVVPPGWVTEDAFLAGYGAAQAVPGPLFAFAAYLGAAMSAEPDRIAGAALCLVALFLPGLLVLAGALPFWNAFRAMPAAQAAMRGTNAAVVGILGAALYEPVFTSAVVDADDFAVALAGLFLLTAVKAPPWLVVLALAGGSVGLALMG
ncbi:MAG: chromate efflux transporter [Alphaproteobacteria bacterium]|nr:chromate efflux transporter [Alphaproteobacteria bacterium]